MTYEHRDGQGTLFKNGKKEAGSKQPDYRGTIMLGGVVYEIAGWVKNSGKGPFLSLNGKPQGDAPRKSRPREDDPVVPF